MHKILRLGAYGLALMAIVGAGRPAFAATDPDPGFFTYMEPASHLTSEVSVLSDDSYIDCNHICRASAKSAKDWCLAHPLFDIGAIAAAAGAAAQAGSEFCQGTGPGWGTLCRAACWAAASAAGAVASADLKHTCAAVGAVQYGACMSGCTPY